MNTITLQLRSIVAIPFFLIWWQFFAAALTFVSFPFPLLLFFSSTLAALSTLICIHAFRERISLRTLGLASSISLISTFLFSLRLNWHIPDYICPTGLLGLVTQVAHGNFPVTFLSFPEIVMNYHQGFIFLAGTLSYLTPLAPGAALKLTYCAIFFIINVLATLYFAHKSNRYYLLVPVLFASITSLSPKLLVDLGLFYNYVSIFEQSTSNSFPLTFLVILLAMFVGDQKAIAPDKKIGICIALLLTTLTINVTLFSLGLLAGIATLAYHFWHIKKMSVRTNDLAVYAVVCSSLAGMYIIAHGIPSPLLSGHWYDAPALGIRILETPFFKYGKHVVRYILLSGPITILGLLVSYQTLKRPELTTRTVMSITLILSFLFPIIFIFKNIDMWDNLHKFAIINLYLALLLVIMRLGEAPARWLKRGLILCVLLSMPALATQVTTRWSSDYYSHIAPSPEIADIVAALKDTNVTALIPYQIDISEQCDETGYAAVSEHAGIALRYAYFANFLLAPAIETAEQESERWDMSTSSIARELKNTPSDTRIIIRKDAMGGVSDFLSTVRTIAPSRTVQEFNHFYLY